MMLTKINPKKVYGSADEARTDILEALSGEWGAETSNGVKVYHVGGLRILQGTFSGDASAVDVPVADSRFPLYFHDTQGNSNMVMVEKGSKFVAKPENISGGFAVFAMV